MTTDPHVGEEPASPFSGAGPGSTTAADGAELPPGDSSEMSSAALLVEPPEFEGDRPSFPGRLRFGRLARAKGLPGAPVTRAVVPPDVVLDGFRLEAGIARVASVRGDGHRYAAEPRQDSASCRWIPGEAAGWAILAVADGVGSQPMSEVGSATALEALHEIPAALWASIAHGDKRAVETAVEHINERLQTEAFLRNAELRHLSSTLTMALIDLDTSTASVVRVGDSPAFLVRNGEWLHIFDEGDVAEIASTGTDCLPAAAPVIEHQRLELRRGDILLVCTDGFSGTLRVDGRDAYLAEHWLDRPPTLTELLWQVDAMVKSYDDDRSVAGWWVGFDD